MKKYLGILATMALSVSLIPIRAQVSPQPAGMPGLPAGPRLSGGMAKLFGANTAFSANLTLDNKDPYRGDDMIMSGTVAFADGKSRFQTEISKIKSARIAPVVVTHMKAMGVDSVIMISRPDKKLAYQVYPTLHAYVEGPMDQPEATATPEQIKIVLTELGKETVDNHPCVKDKALISYEHGRQEATLWNATDFNQFPVRIQYSEGVGIVTLAFKDVDLARPKDVLFEPPAGYKRYDSMSALIQQELAKPAAGSPGTPPTPPPPR